MRWLAASALLVVLLVVTLSALALHTSRQLFRQRALDASQNVTALLAQTIDADLARVALALQAFALAREDAIDAGRGDDAMMEHLLADQQSLLVGVDAVRMADAQGRVVHGRGVAGTAPIDVADRDYFIDARDGPHGATVVSEPLFARISKRWVVVVAHRLEERDGRFAGVVYALLPSEHFDGLIDGPQIGPQGAISVRSAGLRLIARRTGSGEKASGIGGNQVSAELRTALASSPAAGTFVARTAIDGVDRASAYQRVGNHPVYVLVGLATQDYLAPWRSEVTLVGGLTAMAVAVFTLASVLVARAWQRASASRLAMEQEAHRQRALLRTASDGIHVLARDGRIVELSDSFAQSLGYAHDEMLALTIASFDAGLDDDPPLAERLRAFRVGERLAFSGRQRRRDGAQIEVDVVGIGVRLDGEELLYCAARDVTERRRDERALRASRVMLDRTGRLARVGGWELDLRSGRMTWSDEVCRLHGVAPGHAPTLAQMLAYYPSPGREQLDQAFQAALRDGTPWDIELDLPTTDGRRLRVRAVGERESEGGSPARLVGAIQDVTESEQRKHELAREQASRAELERHAAELDALLRERSEMLDVMAHEVRQPLNNASAALQAAAAALRELGAGPASQRVQRAQTVMGQVLASIDNTLAVASLLARPAPLAREDGDIDTLVGLAIADMPPAERGRIVVERRSTTRTASMDMSLMRLALRNLLSNALKFSPPGAPVTVRIDDCDEPLALLIDVVDQGPGIPAALQPVLFERRPRERGVHAGQGLGLGLYIVRRVMELHGGRVERIDEGPGCTVMRLVVDQAPEA